MSSKEYFTLRGKHFELFLKKEPKLRIAGLFFKNGHGGGGGARKSGLLAANCFLLGGQCTPRWQLHSHVALPLLAINVRGGQCFRQVLTDHSREAESGLGLGGEG